MSGAARKPVGWFFRVRQVVILAALFAVYFWAAHLMPDQHGGLSTIAAVGFLLLVGTLVAELLEPLGFPHLTAYIAAGAIAGPHVLHLLDHETVEQVSKINTLAVAIIALAGGAELKLETLRRGLRSLLIASAVQNTLLILLMAGVFLACRPLIPFVQGVPLAEIIAVALMWGVFAITRSPAATLGILAQTRARGPVMDFTMSQVMSSDVIVIVILALVLTLTRPLIEPGAMISLATFKHIGHELLGSVSLGTTLGLAMAIYLRFVERQLLPVLLLLGFGFTEVLRYLNFDPLLTFLVAGFVVQNMSKQGDKFMHALEGASKVVYVLFFAGAGAHLNLPLLRELWIVALILSGTRGVFTYLLHRLGSRIANDEPVVRRWGWSGLVSQAGVSLSVAGIIEGTLHNYGSSFRALAVACIALNEMIGPILLKLGLDRAGETEARRVANGEAPTDAPAAAAH